MSNNGWVDPRIQSVGVAGMRSYLISRGWQLQPQAGQDLLVFGGPVDDDGEPIVQVLPSSERMRDFRMRAEELIAALSIFEDRPASDVLTDILRVGVEEQAIAGTEKNGSNAFSTLPTRDV